MKTSSRKALGLWTLIALVVGNMVGSGIFLLPSALASVGSISLIAWIITVVGAMCIALVFARLGRAFPKIGGPYAYCREGFGDFVGFQVAYNYWIYTWVGNAAIAIALTGYISFFIPEIATNHLLAFFVAAGMVWLLTLVNILGVRKAGIVQVLSVFLKIIPLIIIASLGLFFLHPEHLTSGFNVTHQSTFTALSSAVALTLWSFTGVESATIPADDIENPRRNIPRATIIGTVISALLYIFGTIAVMGVIPMHTLAQSNAPFADAARVMFGSIGAIVIAIAAIISSFGALNGWILLQGQVPLAAAKDNLFPKSFAKLTKHGTPIVGLIAASTLITILLYLGYNQSLVQEFTTIILLATVTILIIYLFTCMAELILFIQQPEKFSKLNLTKASIVTIVATGYILWAIIGAGKNIVFYGALLFFSSVPVYVWVRYRNRASQASHQA